MTRLVTSSQLVVSAYAIRTFDHRYLINHGDGTLFDRDNHDIVSLNDHYRAIRTVYNSQHQIIAKRSGVGAPLLKPLVCQT